jgi:hypothetical protein
MTEKGRVRSYPSQEVTRKHETTLTFSSISQRIGASFLFVRGVEDVIRAGVDLENVFIAGV